VATPACAHYRPAPLTADAGAAALESRTLDDRALGDFVRARLGREADPWPPASWDLATLTLVAFYFHPGLDVARAAWSVARAEVVTAGGRGVPEATVEAGHVTDTDDPSARIAGLSLELPLAAGKRRHRIAAARARSEAARLAVTDSAWSVRQRVRESLLDLWDAEGRLARGASRERIVTEIVQMLERRLEVGEASRPEVTRERLALGRAQLAVRDAERDREQARAALAAALTLPAEALAGATFAFSSFEEAPPDELAARPMRERALLGRADVLALLSEYAAADAALRLEVARQHPDLRLAPGYTYEQGESHFLLGLSVPLAFLGRNRGPIAEAEARRQETAARFLALQARVLGDTDLAVAALAAARRAVETAAAIVARQNESRDAAASSLAAGTSDRLTLRAAELELAEAEDARFRALVEQQRALGRLEGSVQAVLTGPAAVLPSAEAPPRADNRSRP
jgi:outer membrane protein TolC